MGSVFRTRAEGALTSIHRAKLIYISAAYAKSIPASP